MPIQISAISHYLPENLLTNQELEYELAKQNPHFKTIPGILNKTTGIESRLLASHDEYSSTLAAKATLKIFESENINKNDIDLLIYASATQDLIEPATSHIIQDQLGTNAVCFDIKNACNSFLNGLEVATSLLINGYNKALLVVGEKPSVTCKYSLHDRQDFKNSFAGYTFGDAGAAVLLEKSNNNTRGIFYQKSVSLSKYWSAGTLPGGGTRHPRGDEYTYFSGGGIALKDAFNELGPAFLHNSLQEMQLNYADFSRVFVHQVSMPFLKDFTKIVGLDINQVEITFPKFGNLAAATLPVGVSIALENGRVKTGDKILLIGLAGGISLGVTAIQI